MLSDTIFYAPADGQSIQKAVIMLHGYGADGNDLISMAPYMAKDLPNTVFYAPNAPTQQGAGYKWFNIDELAADTVFEHFDYLQRLMERAKPVLPSIFDFIQKVANKYNLKPEQVVLMGFSQGGLLALMSGLLYAPSLGGIIGCSAVPLTINDSLSLNDVKSKPPVLLTHGTDDDVVPFIGMQISQSTLKNIGCQVQTHTVDGMGHNIDASSMDAMIKFIASV